MGSLFRPFNIIFALNICSFVHQCNAFTFYFLLIVYIFRPHTAIFKCYSILCRSWCSVMPIFAYVMLPDMCFSWCCAYCQCPFVTIFVLSLWPPKKKHPTPPPQTQHKYTNKRTLTKSTTSGEAHGWQHHTGKNWHNRTPASGEYTITPDDGSARPKHVDE
jgi:hypothetical protein